MKSLREKIKRKKHAHNRHISDKYSTKQERNQETEKTREEKKKTTKQIMVQSGSFTTEVGLILKAQFRRSAVQ